MFSEEVDQIIKALIEVRSKCAWIPKSGHNKFHNYDYATEADISAHISPLMDDAGLILIPSVASEKDGFKQPFIDDQGITQAVLSYTLAHKSGQVWPEKLYVVAQGNDRDSKGNWGDKGCWKMSTGAFKYCLLRLLMVATGDDPELDNSSEVKDPPKAEKAKQERRGRVANEKERARFRSACYARAQDLNKKDDDQNHQAAGSIGKCAMGTLALAGNEWEAKFLEPLIEAVGKCELDGADHAYIPETPDKF